MQTVQHARGLRSALDALASGNALLPGQIYLLTDEGRIAVALSAGTYETFAKEAEAGGDISALQSEIATARGGRAALGDRLSVISNFASPNAGGVVIGQYYDNAFHASGAATLAGAANRIDLSPFYTSAPMTIDQIGVAVSTGAAAAQGKVVIYASGATGWPSTLFFESGALDFATTGFKSETLDFTFQSGTQYWVGVRHSSTATLRAVAIASSPNIGLLTSAATTYGTVLRRTLTFADPAPAVWNFVNGDRVAAINPTSIRFRAAENIFYPTPTVGSMAAFGDSILAIGVESATKFTVTGLVGGIIANGAKVTAMTNYAVGGTVTADLAGQISGTGPTTYKTAIICSGSNDAFDLVSVATVMANLRAAGAALKGAGKRVAVCVPIQRNDQRLPIEDSWNSTRETRLQEIRDALIAEPVGPYWDVLIRTDQVPEWSTDGVVPNADVTKGGTDDAAVHPNPKGTYFLSKKILDTLDASLSTPATTTKFSSSLAGTAGGSSPTFSGDLASAWLALGDELSGVSGALTKPASDEQKITFSGTATTLEYGLVFDATVISGLSGERLRVKMDIKTESMVGLSGLEFGLANSDSFIFKASSLAVQNTASDFSEMEANIGGAGFRTVYSPWFTLGANENLRIAMLPSLLNGAAVSGALTFRNVSVEKLT